jgi:hypothetical protein
MIFTCASDAQVAMVRITEQLFRELQTFGRLAAEAPVTADMLETHIKNRLPVTNSTFALLAWPRVAIGGRSKVQRVPGR